MNKKILKDIIKDYEAQSEIFYNLSIQNYNIYKDYKNKVVYLKNLQEELEHKHNN